MECSSGRQKFKVTKLASRSSHHSKMISRKSLKDDWWHLPFFCTWTFFAIIVNTPINVCFSSSRPPSAALCRLWHILSHNFCTSSVRLRKLLWTEARSCSLSSLQGSVRFKRLKRWNWGASRAHIICITTSVCCSRTVRTKGFLWFLPPYPL